MELVVKKEFAYCADITWDYGKQGIPAADLNTTLTRVLQSLRESPTYVKDVHIIRVPKPDWLINEELMVKNRR